MTIAELIAALTRFVEQDATRGAIPVTFGNAMVPVKGGIIGQFEAGLILNLAPVRLDKVGGF